jgi:hypothetical protein
MYPVYRAAWIGNYRAMNPGRLVPCSGGNFDPVT